MIMYGCGHYVRYFINTEEVSWFQYDDIYISKIATGKLKDDIQEMIKYRYAPVDVFYEKSRKWNLIQCCRVSKKEQLILENKSVQTDNFRDYLYTKTSTRSFLQSESSHRYSYLDRYSTPSTESSNVDIKSRPSKLQYAYLRLSIDKYTESLTEEFRTKVQKSAYCKNKKTIERIQKEERKCAKFEL